MNISVKAANETTTPRIKYPCLMQGIITGKVLLMLNETDGVVLQEGSGDAQPGERIKDLSKSGLKLWYGTVTLSETARDQ